MSLFPYFFGVTFECLIFSEMDMERESNAIVEAIMNHFDVQEKVVRELKKRIAVHEEIYANKDKYIDNLFEFYGTAMAEMNNQLLQSEFDHIHSAINCSSNFLSENEENRLLKEKLGFMDKEIAKMYEHVFGGAEPQPKENKI